MISKPFALGCLLFIAGACVLSSGCAEQPPPQQSPRHVVAEAPPPPVETNPTPDTATARGAPDLPPPEATEVDGAVERVFKGAVIVESGLDARFVVGDFNGDSSQDLAVVVRPAPGKLAEMNDELANWILRAPVTPARKDSSYLAAHAEAATRRVVVDEGDILLTVIHGFGPKGWRDAQATQTYVLKDAAGVKLEAKAQKIVLRAVEEEKLPRLRGDVIAQTIGGQSGFIYYDGAMYAWYDPRNYKPAPPARVVHGGAVKSVRQ